MPKSSPAINMFTKSSFNECEALMASRVKQVRTNACGAFARKKIHKASKEYHIEYKEFYSNHIAHLLVAMDGLGGTFWKSVSSILWPFLLSLPGLTSLLGCASTFDGRPKFLYSIQQFFHYFPLHQVISY